MRAAHGGAAEAAAALDERVHARRWWTLATLCISLLIITLDNTILNVAIPSMIDDLGASNSDMATDHLPEAMEAVTVTAATAANDASGGDEQGTAAVPVAGD